RALARIGLAEIAAVGRGFDWRVPMARRDRKTLLGNAGKAAVGLAAAAAAAYGVYLWGNPSARRRPVTELPLALNLRLQYHPWRSVHYAYYSRSGSGRPIVILHSINAV